MESSAENTTEVKDAGLIFPDVEGIPTVLRHTRGGAALGLSAAALVSLIQDLKLNRRLAQQAEAARNPEDDENTIVLSLPPKQASDPGTFAWSMLGALGGGVGSYQLARALYHKHIMKKLEKEEEAARNEVLDQLMSSTPKQAQAGEDTQTFSLPDKALGLYTLLNLLGVGATGYLTKKVLDAKFKEVDREKYEPPQVQKVIFRSTPLEADTDEEKRATDEDVEAIKDLFLLHLIKASGDYSVFEDPAVKAAMEKAGQAQEDLMSMLDDPVMAATMRDVLKDPSVRDTIKARYLANNPTLSKHPWLQKFLGSGGLGAGLADWQLERELGPVLAYLDRQQEAPKGSIMPQPAATATAGPPAPVTLRGAFDSLTNYFGSRGTAPAGQMAAPPTRAPKTPAPAQMPAPPVTVGSALNFPKPTIFQQLGNEMRTNPAYRQFNEGRWGDLWKQLSGESGSQKPVLVGGTPAKARSIGGKLPNQT